jgi:cell division septum initiation protein DivIVA
MTNPSDVLPVLAAAERGFDPALRGYDRDQVDRYVTRSEDDLRLAMVQRDSALSRSADLAAQLAAANAQLESVRRQLRVANEAVTPDNVDTRVRHLVEAAQADASQLRMETEMRAEEVRVAMAEQSSATLRAADEDAARTRTSARDQAAAILDDAQQRADALVAAAQAKCVEADDYHRDQVAEADSHRAWIESDLAWLASTAATERERLDAEAEAERARFEDLRQQTDDEAAVQRAHLDAMHEAERERLDTESAQSRQLAEDDFEIVLRARRTAEVERSEQLLHDAEVASSRLVREAQELASRLIEDAVAEVHRLHAERDAAHENLREVHTKLAAAIAVALAPAPPQAS